jgi:hypothetical protein
VGASQSVSQSLSASQSLSLSASVNNERELTGADENVAIQQASGVSPGGLVCC